MELPPPPDIYSALSSFRHRRLYCDVCLQFPQPSRQNFYAHSVVLAVSSSFFANAYDEVASEHSSEKQKYKTILLPPSIEEETMAFILCWMYNEAPKIELTPSNVGKYDDRSMAFLRDLRHAVEALEITDLSQFFKRHKEGFPHLDGFFSVIRIIGDTNSEPRDRCEGLANGDHQSVVNGYLEDDDFKFVDRDRMTEDVLNDNSHQTDGRVLKVKLTRLNVMPDGDPSNKSCMPMIKNEPTDLDDLDEVDAMTENIDSMPSKKLKKKKSREQQQKLTTKKKSKHGPPVTCEKCGLSYKKYRRGEHNRIFHGPDEKEKLKKLFSQESNDPVLQNMVTDDTFTCSTCNHVIVKTKLHTITRFNRICATHLYHAHNVVCPNICRVCPVETCKIVLIGKPAADNHLKNKHTNPAPKKECTICGKLVSVAHLNKHVKVIHGDEGTPCPVCGKIFNDPSYLQFHIRSHDEKKSYKCEWCSEKETNDLYSYRHHIYRHHGIVKPTGAKVHKCPECDYSSPVYYRVKFHYKCIHPPDASFLCKEPGCEKAFKTKRALKYHVGRIHQGKGETECDVCFQSE